MPTADSGLIIACVAAYLGICAGIGVWAMRRTNSAADFFLAGKSLGPSVVVMASISSVMSGFGFVGGPGLVYESGSSSLWMAFVCSFSLPTAYLLTGKRLRLLAEVRPILTLPEAVAARYGGVAPPLAMSLAIFLGVIGYLGTQVLAIGTVLQAVLGIDLLTALGIGLGVLAFYSVAGGIVAGVYTDLFQGVLMLGAAVAVLAVCLQVGGGLEAISHTLWDMDPEFIGPWGSRGEMAAMSWMLLFGVGAAGQPHFITKLMMLKDIRRLQWSALATGASYLVLATLWMGIGLAMRTVVARGEHPELANPDLAAPTFLLHYAPELLAGLVFAGLLAAIMSTADSFLNLGAAAIVRDIPMALLGRPLRRELYWSRVVTGLLLLLSAALRALHGKPDRPAGNVRVGNVRRCDRPQRVHRAELETSNGPGVRRIDRHQHRAQLLARDGGPERPQPATSGAGGRRRGVTGLHRGLRARLAIDAASETRAGHRRADGRLAIGEVGESPRIDGPAPRGRHQPRA